MKHRAYDESRERLFEAPCRVIDFLPRQVPAECGGKYFAVERYLRAHPQIDELYSRFAWLLVKLSCYYDLAAYDPQADAWEDNPPPEEMVRRILACCETGPDRYFHIYFPTEDTLLTLEGDDLYMTLYQAKGVMLETVARLTTAEGLFLREPEPGGEGTQSREGENGSAGSK